MNTLFLRIARKNLYKENGKWFVRFGAWPPFITYLICDGLNKRIDDLIWLKHKK